MYQSITICRSPVLARDNQYDENFVLVQLTHPASVLHKVFPSSMDLQLLWFEGISETAFSSTYNSYQTKVLEPRNNKNHLCI
jgi:hypothetical protein